MTHGYVSEKDALIKRLHRIEGQVRGIERMVDDERYCIDILTQIAAVSTALESVSVKLLEDHVRHCVADALAAGDAEVAEQKERGPPRRRPALLADALGLGSLVLEPVRRELHRPLERAAVGERREEVARVDGLVGAGLEDPERDERERIEADTGVAHRRADVERLLRERELHRHERVAHGEIALLLRAKLVGRLPGCLLRPLHDDPRK